MINYNSEDSLLKNTADKQWIIEAIDGSVSITNNDIEQQSIELEESLCSESTLKFGCCEAASLKFKVRNVAFSIKGKAIKVKLFPNENKNDVFLIGIYKIFEETLTADKKVREITAYDAMYDIINADVAQWYNGILPDSNSTVTMKQFRTSFIKHFGLEQEEAELINDDMIIEKTVEITASSQDDDTDIIGEALSGKDVITAICEINGCFGHIGRNGKFQWIYLKQNIEGLYPSQTLYPADDLYPRNPGSIRIGAGGSYVSCQYEDFKTQRITRLQIRQEENDIGATIPPCDFKEDDNCYVVEDNFLVYGKSTDELNAIGANILSKISGIRYRPFEAVVQGDPCIEVGDAVRLSTRYDLIESYVLKRTLKGVQALRDTFSADGEEKYSERVNSVRSEIKQLKGKANILTRTIEETTLKMIDMQGDFDKKLTEIEITAEGLKGSISAVSTDLETATNEIYKYCDNKIKISAEEMSSEISKSTQGWDTSGYDIEYTGEGEPTIDVVAGKYYLDKETGYIWIGVAATSGVYQKADWETICTYRFNGNAFEFEKYLTEDEDFADNSLGFKPPAEVTYSTMMNWGFNIGTNPGEYDGSEEGEIYIEAQWLDEMSETPREGDYATFWAWREKKTIIEPTPAYWKKDIETELITVSEMSTKISQAAYNISMKVNVGEVTTYLNLEKDMIDLGSRKFRLDTLNLKINADASATSQGSGEVFSRDMTAANATESNSRYIKLSAGGLLGGYGADNDSNLNCKIVCNKDGLEFRGKVLTFCMNTIKVGTGGNSANALTTTDVKTAYTGDIKYAVQQTDGSIKSATLQFRNGLLMAND